MKSEDLVGLCADICYFAQEHTADEDAWGPRGSKLLSQMMEPTSYTVSCFIAQNTVYGFEGVEWEIVHEELIGPVLTRKQWVEVLEEKVKLFHAPPIKRDALDDLFAGLDRVYQEWKSKLVPGFNPGCSEFDEDAATEAGYDKLAKGWVSKLRSYPSDIRHSLG
jgi:hypothetical protein